MTKLNVTERGKMGPTRATRRRRTLVALFSILGACLLGAAPAAAQQPDNLGTEFWLGFPTNAECCGSPTITLFITGPEAATGTVEIPGLAFTAPFTVTPGTVTSVELPNTADMSGGEGTEDKGIHVTADKEVAVYGLNRIQFTTDAYLGLPVDVLGTEYTVMTWGPGAGGPAEFSVVSTQDGTVVTVTPSITAGVHTAGTPYTVTLNKGQEYQLQANSSPQDLTGTKVASTAPVAIFGGNECANIPDTSFGACDHVVEQVTPDATWGRSFLTVPLATRMNGDTFKFLATEDGTEVKVNDSVVATLNDGQQHQMIIAGNSQIESSKPIFVSQFSNGSTYDGVTSDPFMMTVPPFEQFQTGYTVTTPAAGFAANFINLVVPNSSVGAVKVDGVAVPASDYTPIGSSSFQGAQVPVSLGSHTVTGDGQPFGVFVYGFDSFDSYGYSGGLSLAPIARVTSLDLSPETATHPVNSEQCVTAKVTDQSANPLAGVRVDFNVTGANSAQGSVNTEVNGEAKFCYTGANPGEDTITGTVGALSDAAKKTWFTGGALSGTVYDDANGNGTRDGGEGPLPGVPVYVDKNGNSQLDAGESSTQSAADGSWSIVNVEPGAATVRTVPPPGYQCSAPANCTYSASVTSGGTTGGLDFGLRTPPVTGLGTGQTGLCPDTRPLRFVTHHAPGVRITRVRVYVNEKLVFQRRSKKKDIKSFVIPTLPQTKGTVVRIILNHSNGAKVTSVRVYDQCLKSTPTYKIKKGKKKKRKKG